MKLNKCLSATFDDGRVLVLTEDARIAVRYMLAVDAPIERPPALILAIKFLRSRYDLGLKDAKDIIDCIRDDPRLLDS